MTIRCYLQETLTRTKLPLKLLIMRRRRRRQQAIPAPYLRSSKPSVTCGSSEYTSTPAVMYTYIHWLVRQIVREHSQRDYGQRIKSESTTAMSTTPASRTCAYKRSRSVLYMYFRNNSTGQTSDALEVNEGTGTQAKISIGCSKKKT